MILTSIFSDLSLLLRFTNNGTLVRADGTMIAPVVVCAGAQESGLLQLIAFCSWCLSGLGFGVTVEARKLEHSCPHTLEVKYKGS